MTDTIAGRPAALPRVVKLVERPAAVVRVEGTMAELPRMLGEAFGLTAGAIAASGAKVAGPPFARYLSFGERIEAEVGFPFAGTLVPTDRVSQVILPGGPAVTTTHVGAYDQLAATWGRTTAWMDEHGFECASPAWESYLTGPDDPGPTVTEIVWPVVDAAGRPGSPAEA